MKKLNDYKSHIHFSYTHRVLQPTLFSRLDFRDQDMIYAIMSCVIVESEWMRPSLRMYIAKSPASVSTDANGMIWYLCRCRSHGYRRGCKFEGLLFQ